VARDGCAHPGSRSGHARSRAGPLVWRSGDIAVYRNPAQPDINRRGLRTPGAAFSACTGCSRSAQAWLATLTSNYDPWERPEQNALAFRFQRGHHLNLSTHPGSIV
jgi:hypothetical protein